VRWLQFGIFCPLCRVHCDQFRRREPWVFGEQIEAIARQCLQLRYRLLPYLYSLYYQAHTRGLPIMRPLLLHYEDDPETRGLADQFLCGPYVLVAPVLAPGARTRRLYLPAGVWHDGWSGERRQGPAWIETAAPLERIPLFVRAGALIPFGPRLEHTGQRPLDPLAVHYYAGAGGQFELYEDDGVSNGYRRGEFCLTPLCADVDGDVIQLRVEAARGALAGSRPERTVLFWLHGLGEVSAIRRDEGPLPALASREAWRKMKIGWFRDAERDLIGVKVQPTAGPLALQVHLRSRLARRSEAGA
jgi:alpha-glucosidase